MNASRFWVVSYWVFLALTVMSWFTDDGAGAYVVGMFVALLGLQVSNEARR